MIYQSYVGIQKIRDRKDKFHNWESLMQNQNENISIPKINERIM